jgi:uncharacterized protein
VQHTTQAAIAQWLSDLIEVRALDVEARDARLRVAIEYVVRASGELRRDVLTRETTA